MSNVKTGDIAFFMINDGNWPTCQVGLQEIGTEARIQTNQGAITINYSNPLSLRWWCKFPQPIMINYNRADPLLCDYLPINDTYLKRICDGNFSFSNEEYKLCLPVPLDADERARWNEQKKRKGTVK